MNLIYGKTNIFHRNCWKVLKEFLIFKFNFGQACCVLCRAVWECSQFRCFSAKVAWLLIWSVAFWRSKQTLTFTNKNKKINWELYEKYNSKCYQQKLYCASHTTNWSLLASWKKIRWDQKISTEKVVNSGFWKNCQVQSMVLLKTSQLQGNLLKGIDNKTVI